MDPITAFSLACGVIQVIDFSVNVLSKCRRIHKHGSLSENENIESMAEQLTTLRADLQPTTLSTSTRTATSSGDRDLIQLSSRCSEMAKELVGELQSLKAGSTGSRWKAISSTYRSLKKRSMIDRMQKQLDELRSILNTKVLADLRQRSIQNSLLQTEGFRQLDHKIQTLGDRLTYSRPTFDELKEVLRKQSESSGAHFDSRFEQHEQILAKTAYDKAFLESLWYPDIQAREEGIKEAHAKTFEWLLDESETAVKSWDNFVAWLQGGQGTYWISGKAGSGKSTLMRYICDNHRTNSLLRAWAGSREVLIAKFFFWRAGSSVQKTIVGLLRSLLYQIFSALPELIGIVSADNVSPVSQHAALPAWTEARLHKYLKALLWKLVKSHRVCFFLDGLDELDQKHERMVSMVRDLTEDENVKICLSSRPYRIFSDSFSSSAMLKLQDLTEADIRTYISESLLPRGSIPILEESGATSSMSEIIVERADGVFLWAELVVREVNRGITNEDSQQQLVNRLNSLPDEIEQLYSYMLGCIDTVYKNEAARCFAATSRGFCSLLQLSLVILEGNRDDHPVAFADLSAAQTLDLCNSTARRLPTTCAGLLEVQENRHIFGVIADNNLLSDVARLILPLQFAAPVTDPDEIPQGVLEVLRIQLCTSVQSVHRTALDFLQENSVGIKFMKDHNGYAVHDSVSRLHRMVATWRLLGCIDLSQYVTESKEYRKWAGRSHTEKSLPGFLDLRRFHDNAMENLLIRAVRTESITATAQSALWDYVERATIVTNSQYLTKLKGGPCLQLPHSSCMIEPAPREDQCDEKSVTLGSKIEDSPQTADRNVINAGDEAPMMVSSMPEDFLGFAAFYSLSLYVEYRFHSEMGLQDRNKVTYLLACFVSNIVWSVSEDQEKDLGENLDEQADAHRLLQFLRGLLDRGADPNALTASSTIWGNFLEHLYSAYHRDLIYGKTFSRTVWASMTMVFLDKGADTARIWNLRSGALWRFDFALAGDDWVDIILEVADFENFLFGFNKSFSTFTILHKCLRDCDEWAYISNKLNASQKEHISKCTRFYFSHPGPEGWEPFIGYALSDQQSKDFLHVFEGFLETPSEYTRLRLELADHVLDLRRELEKERSGAGTTLVERTGISR